MLHHQMDTLTIVILEWNVIIGSYLNLLIIKLRAFKKVFSFFLCVLKAEVDSNRKFKKAHIQSTD